MRWERLFDDLQSRLEAAERDGRDEVLAELIEAEVASIDIAARLRGMLGRRVRALMRDGTHHHGTAAECGPDWLLLAHGERQALLPLSALSWVAPLGVAAPPPGLVASKLGLAYALRALARARVPVQLFVPGSEPLRGVLSRVGADHVDLTPDMGTPVALSVPMARLTAVTTV